MSKYKGSLCAAHMGTRLHSPADLMHQTLKEAVTVVLVGSRSRPFLHTSPCSTHICLNLTLVRLIK